MTVSGDICMCVYLCMYCLLPFAQCHEDVWVFEVDLAVPDKVGQGMHSYVGGSSEVN